MDYFAFTVKLSSAFNDSLEKDDCEIREYTVYAPLSLDCQAWLFTQGLCCKVPHKKVNTM